MDTIQSYKCPCCGAPLVFGAQSQSLHCDSCGNDFPLDRVLFGASVLLWSDYHPDLLENKDE